MPRESEREQAREAGQRADRFWAIELGSDERRLLEEAFRRDRDLRRDTGLMLFWLLELRLRDTFVRAFLSRLRQLRGGRAPARAVLPALDDTLEVARARGEQRAAQPLTRRRR